ncbi:MAG: 1,4-dihydroxy-2-naphthoate polyprenyltransferase [Polyangiaceae bacterium]
MTSEARAETTAHARPSAPAAAAPGVRPGSFGAWLLASRPATLTAAVVPVVLGTAVAHALGDFKKGPAIAALLGAMLIQIATNFANDVFDAEKGADTEERLGPTRAVQAGLLTPRQVRTGMLVTIALAVMAGLYLTFEAGWPVVAIGVASILSGVAYTGGPYPLGYHGLGDVFVMLFFGFVAVCGTVFVETGSVPLLAVLASIPAGGIATCILVVNNLRDRHTDVKAGKRTLAVRLGRAGVLIEYALLALISYSVPVALAAQHQKPWLLLPLASFPVAALLFRRIVRSEGKELNPCLAGTARLLLLFGVLFAVGLVLSRPLSPGL